MPVALLREDLNYSGERARSVECALRPPHNLDPVDVVGGNVGEVHSASQTLVDRNAVEQHLRVFTWQPAHENGSQLTGGSSLHHGQPRHFAERIATRWICFCSKSCEVTTLTLAGDWSSGMSVRVPVITIGSDSAAGVGDESWA